MRAPSGRLCSVLALALVGACGDSDDEGDGSDTALTVADGSSATSPSGPGEGSDGSEAGGPASGEDDDTGSATASGTATADGSESGDETTSDTGAGGEGISKDYPGDVGIGDHPSVIFFEDFEDPDVGTLAAGWDNATLPEALSLSGDVPAGSVPGSQSLTMTVSDGGGVTLYESFDNQEGEVYVRYYARYNLSSDYHHTGMWIGGYNPPTPWPQGNAGLQPSGSDFFHNTFEPAGSDGGLLFDHYA